MLQQDMALLLLLWQEACLEHDTENGELIPGAKSATLEEEKILDAVKEEENMTFSWDDFNKAYMSFPTASARLAGCLEALKEASYEYRVKTIRYLFAMASASFENNSSHAISETESAFILSVKKELAVDDESVL